MKLLDVIDKLEGNAFMFLVNLIMIFNGYNLRDNFNGNLNKFIKK